MCMEVPARDRSSETVFFEAESSQVRRLSIFQAGVWDRDSIQFFMFDFIPDCCDLNCC